MFSEIAAELVKSLQDAMPEGSKEMVVSGTPAQPPGPLPRLYVYSPRFTFEDGGLGGGGTESIEPVTDTLTSDGKKVLFTLSTRPYKPLLRVESPPGESKRENTDYTVNYSKGSLTFKTPPKGSVLVKYNSAARSGKTRNVKLNLVYSIDVCAADERQRDDLTIEAIKAVALAQEGLSMKGFELTPLDGADVPPDPEKQEKVFVKRLNYSVQANLQVKVPVPVIESVEVKQLPPEA